MTESLPGSAIVKQVVLDKATEFTLGAIPRIPDGVKRLVLGGRSVTVDGNTLDTTMQFLLTVQRVSGLGALVADHTSAHAVEVSRTRLATMASMLRTDIAVDVAELSIPGPAGPIRARRYSSGTAERTDLLVFFHGGGYVIGGLDTHDDLCRLICRDGGVQVLSVDYRMAPEHKAPAAVDDGYAAYLWALEHGPGLGASRIVVAGDSAGGNLATVVARRARDNGVRLPALQVLLYPVTDWSSETRSKTLFADGYYLHKRDMDWFAGHYLDGADVAADDPEVSPLLAEDLSGLPPALVYTGGFDPLRDEGNRYAHAMAAAGVPVDLREERSLIHGFANFFPLGGRSATATAAMISAMRAHLARSVGHS
jgi:acetyl esterase